MKLYLDISNKYPILFDFRQKYSIMARTDPSSNPFPIYLSVYYEYQAE